MGGSSHRQLRKEINKHGFTYSRIKVHLYGSCPGSRQDFGIFRSLFIVKLKFLKVNLD
jgi:hypothetical protein